MLQTIQGKQVYVVEFDSMPEMPITGLTEEESRIGMYDSIVARVTTWNQSGLLGQLCKSFTMTYAQILTAAIETGVITEPGKYGLYKDLANGRWEAYKIIE